MQNGAGQQHNYSLSCSNGQTNNIIERMPCKGENKQARMPPHGAAMQGR